MSTVLLVVAALCAAILALTGFGVITSTHEFGWLGASLFFGWLSFLAPHIPAP